MLCAKIKNIYAKNCIDIENIRDLKYLYWCAMFLHTFW